MYKLIIPGTLPGLNEYINAERRNRYAAASMKKKVEAMIMAAIKKHPKFTKPVYMHYFWFEPNRRRDKDNIAAWGRKVIQDALVTRGVLQGDGWKHVEGFNDTFVVDKQNPRIEVWIQEVE